MKLKQYISTPYRAFDRALLTYPRAYLLIKPKRHHKREKHTYKEMVHLSTDEEAPPV